MTPAEITAAFYGLSIAIEALSKLFNDKKDDETQEITDEDIEKVTDARNKVFEEAARLAQIIKDKKNNQNA